MENQKCFSMALMWKSPFENFIFKKCSKSLTYEVQLRYCGFKTSCQSDGLVTNWTRRSPQGLTCWFMLGVSADSRAGFVCLDSPLLVWWCSRPPRRDTWAAWFYQRCPDPTELSWAPALWIPSASASQIANPKKHKHSFKHTEFILLKCLLFANKNGKCFEPY